MNINVTVMQKTTKVVEVTLPVYRKHDLMLDTSDTVVYSRTELFEKRLRTIHITVRRDRGNLTYEVETEFGDFNPGNGEDYSTGKGEYASSAEEFERVRRDCVAFVESLRYAPPRDV